ncbi:MAG: hypothetical protein NXI21_14375 [Alphaproteobacteria bacterium]|nr:hypothetical protein [Alphaproteobacteria bacterium]
MSDRRRTPSRSAHPLGREAETVDQAISLRDGFAAPVVAIAGDRAGGASTALVAALAAALGVGAPVPRIDWTDGAPDAFLQGMRDAPGTAAALLLAIDAERLRRAGAHTRAARPDAVLFVGGIDPAPALEAVDALGGARAVVLDQEDPRTPDCIQALAGVKGLRVLQVGRGREAAVRLVEAQLYTTCSAVTVSVGRETLDFCIGTPGLDAIEAAVSALAVVKAVGGDPAASTTRFARAADA